MIDRPQPLRLGLVAILCLVPLTLIVPRLIWLQFLQEDLLGRQARLQNMRRVWYPPHRGEILDRTGNRLAFSVADTLDGSRYYGTFRKMKRLYPMGASAAHVVGYVNGEGIGEGGIEQELENELKGHPGWATELCDGTGRTYLFSDRPGKPVTSGYDVHLTIDADLQDVAMSRLTEAAAVLKAKAGSVVGVDPQTGEILVMASWPAYDPENYRRHGWTERRNRAITDPFEPGSTFKLVTAVTALEQKLFSPNTPIHCENGAYSFRGRVIRDHKPMGLLPFHTCFARSSNIAFAKIGEACGENLFDTARRFGFGSATGIRLPAEANGRVPRPESWSGYTAASIAIGYEILATPLQTAMAYAAVANGGVLLRPYVVEALTDASGRAVFENRPVPVARVLEPTLCREIKRCLGEVVTEGTGTNAALTWVDVGGKTGTTRKLVGGEYSSRNHYASFVGMAPLDDPRIVLVVVLDDPETSYGGAAAAPVFKDVLDAYRRIRGAVLHPRYETVILKREAEGNPLEKLLPDRLYAGDDPPKPGTAGSMGGLPDMRGLPLRTALRLCAGRGLEPRVQGSGVVVRQSPAPGTAEARRVRLICEPPGPAALSSLTVSSLGAARARGS